MKLITSASTTNTKYDLPGLVPKILYTDQPHPEQILTKLMQDTKKASTFNSEYVR